MFILDANKEPAWTSSTKSPGLSGPFHSRELGKIPAYRRGKRAVPDPRRPWPPTQQACSASRRPGCPKEAKEWYFSGQWTQNISLHTSKTRLLVLRYHDNLRKSKLFTSVTRGSISSTFLHLFGQNEGQVIKDILKTRVLGCWNGGAVFAFCGIKLLHL